MHFTASIAAGLLLGLANGYFWKRWGRSLLSKEKRAKQAIILISLLKLGLLTGIIWVLLVPLQLNPVGFLLGLTAPILLWMKELK